MKAKAPSALQTNFRLPRRIKTPLALREALQPEMV